MKKFVQGLAASCTLGVERTRVSVAVRCALCFAEDDLGTRRAELVNWYLKEMESEIETEQELIDRKTLAEKVIYRLIHHVSSSVAQTPLE